MRQTPLGANGCGAPVGGLSVALRGFGGAGGFFVAETHPLRFKGSGIVPAEVDQNLRETTVEEQVGRQIGALKALLLNHFEDGAASQSEAFAAPSKLGRS